MLEESEGPGDFADVKVVGLLVELPEVLRDHIWCALNLQLSWEQSSLLNQCIAEAFDRVFLEGFKLAQVTAPNAAYPLTLAEKRHQELVSEARLEWDAAVSRRRSSEPE